jgi:hypothetical protein
VRTKAIAGGSIQGVGIGLRALHYALIEREHPVVPRFEVLVDNYLGKGGTALHHLARIRRDYPVTLHGVVENATVRIGRVQDFLGQRILVENVSTYLGFRASTLAEIYPVCRALAGARFFQAMSTRCTPQPPSHAPGLDDYGADFAHFLSGFGPVATLPYLPDVARLEWVWHRASIAPDAGSLDLRARSRMGEGDRWRILFRLPEGAVQVTSVYPIHRI